MRDVLRVARSRDDFLALVEDALREKDVNAAAKRQAAVKDGTWDARAEFVSGVIEEALSRKRQPAI